MLIVFRACLAGRPVIKIKSGNTSLKDSEQKFFYSKGYRIFSGDKRLRKKKPCSIKFVAFLHVFFTI